LKLVGFTWRATQIYIEINNGQNQKLQSDFIKLCMVGASVNGNAGGNQNGHDGCTPKTHNQSPMTPTDK
jgi:hypothetical protein